MGVNLRVVLKQKASGFKTIDDSCRGGLATAVDKWVVASVKMMVNLNVRLALGALQIWEV